MPQHKTCILCNSDKLLYMAGYQKAHLCMCKSCDLIFSVEIPTTQELEEFYSNYAANGYISPLTIKRYNELLDKFEPFRKTNKILDVGCGDGHFLEEAKKRGWEVYGNELSQRAKNVCLAKGINVFLGDLDAVNYPAESFDVITCVEVIEHINHPDKEINTFYKLLRTGGLVYLTTPNFNSLLRHRLKEAYNVITFPEHLTYYTQATMNKAFKLRGFKKHKIETTGLSVSRLRTSQGKSNQKINSEKSDDEIIRIQIDSKWYWKVGKDVVNSTLTIFGMGDTIKAWFIKA